ncbi:hypothetical protein RB594_008853 [Gaeumannomyces avenae]
MVRNYKMAQTVYNACASDVGPPVAGPTPVGAVDAGLFRAGAVAGQRAEGLGHAALVHASLLVEHAHLGEATGLDDAAHDEGKRLLDVDLEAGRRLHEAAAVAAGPLEPLGGGDLPALLEVALVAGDDLDGRDRLGAGAGTGREGGGRVAGADAGAGGAGGVVEAVLGLHVDQVVEVAEGVERVARRDVVDHEEGVGAQVGRGPHAAVLLLAGRVGQGQGRTRMSTATAPAAA